jgi:DNA-binding MarR family transcriptional regulator
MDEADGGARRPVNAILLPSPEAVAALRAHPRFAEAARRMVGDLVAIYRGSRVLNQVLNDRGRMTFGFLALYLHFSRNPHDPASGLTAGRMKALCVQTRLCSPGRATAMLLLMRFAGYLAAAPDALDRRVRLLAPTERMIASQRERLACQFRALSLLLPEGAEGLANLDRDDFLFAMAGCFGEAFCSGFRILDTSPAFYPLAESNAGLMIMFNLFLAADANGTFVPTRPVQISISALSQQFHVSRPHITRLLREAAALGFIERQGTSGEEILVRPRLTDAMQDFVATVFLFVAHCVRRSRDELLAPERVRQPRRANPQAIV